MIEGAARRQLLRLATIDPAYERSVTRRDATSPVDAAFPFLTLQTFPALRLKFAIYLFTCSSCSRCFLVEDGLKTMIKKISAIFLTLSVFSVVRQACIRCLHREWEFGIHIFPLHCNPAGMGLNMVYFMNGNGNRNCYMGMIGNGNRQMRQGKCDKIPEGHSSFSHLSQSHKHRLVVSNNVQIPVILENGNCYVGMGIGKHNKANATKFPKKYKPRLVSDVLGQFWAMSMSCIMW